MTNLVENKNLSDKSELTSVSIDGETYLKISNSDEMRPFFMSIVSDSNHWMFISSNGGLSAGRKNADNALFPYYTDDKIKESSEITGSRSIFRVISNDQTYLWEPFSIRGEGRYKVTRNLYKNIYGNKVVFEEINEDLQLSFRYEWNSSDKYGFIKKSKLTYTGQSSIEVSVLDGIQNIMPYGVASDFQNQYSNLVDAYKRSELDQSSGLGIFALSAIIVDKAEPSEALKANSVWSYGFENVKYLLSSLQLDSFRKGLELKGESDIKGEKGAYFINTNIQFTGPQNKHWMMVANVNQNHSAIAQTIDSIVNDNDLLEKVNRDIERGTQNLIALTAASDGLQATADNLRDTRHFANTLFNIMRGGIFDNNYGIEKSDFSEYLKNANKEIYDSQVNRINHLSSVFTITELREVIGESHDLGFTRLCIEYLPLKYSRRHGDPSRPWNKFTINTRSEIDGSKILDYEGNWRDIFQNWEALSHAYPEFIEGMIHKFLNATTFDGYNPYRVTKGGFDWEVIEPDDPWSYIGYWGDHQIIYLLKFLEFIRDHYPERLSAHFGDNLFVYANVPYKIKSFSEIIKNPKDTIDFDADLDHTIQSRRQAIGADGALLQNQNQEIHQVNFIEKILATVLSKLSNFIPEGGIWMNTQRPEWNDANNALVGNGVSMVTLYYLRRFLKYFQDLIQLSEVDTVEISEEVFDFFNDVLKSFSSNKQFLSDGISDENRRHVLEELGKAGSDFRNRIYEKNFSGQKQNLSFDLIRDFVSVSLLHLEHSIEANKREDNLYHAYNLMTVKNDKEVSISNLSEMLEGQVAVLSSGFLSSKEAINVLDGLKSSRLFRADQYSYLLYPYKELPGFLNRNTISSKQYHSSELLQHLVQNGNEQILDKDINGEYHFNGNFKNAGDLKDALDQLALSGISDISESDKNRILEIFEEIFNHKAFTGRSGTFYGYEGLGSIYWHMVSKLQLAVLECCEKAHEEGADKETYGRLLEHYYEINEGIGVHKSPSLYGAFPTDPYSHTPAGKGAQQPGMTGQVKEDILSRFGELGVTVSDGILHFNPHLLRKEEFLEHPEVFSYMDVNQKQKQIHLEKGSLAFTYCQVPIIYKVAEENSISIFPQEEEALHFDRLYLNKIISNNIFQRTGEIAEIIVFLSKDKLK